MSEESKETYGIEPDRGSAAGEQDQSRPRVGRPVESGPTVRPSASSEPLDLEDDPPPSRRSIKDLDVCPNCGGSMGGSGEIVCVRCGFDLKSMRQMHVQTGEVEAGSSTDDSDADDVSKREPLVSPGLGEELAALIVAGVSGVIVIAGFLLGIRGLFPPIVNADGEVIANASIPFTMRLLGVLKLIVNVGIVTACGLGALRFVAFLAGQRVGSWSLAAARMLAIAAFIQLTLFIDLRTFSMESVIEFVLQAVLLGGMAMLALGIKPKDAPTFVGSVAIAYLGVQLVAWIITSVT